MARLVFLGFAAWFAVDPGAVPGAPPLARIAFSTLFLGLSIVVGEILAVRTNLTLLVGALRAGAGGLGARPRDDRAAIDVLVRGLSGPEPEARAKAHKHLKRLTGQDLPPDAEAWETWWAQHRADFPREGRDAPPG